MDNWIGKKIEGRYQIRELIGIGGMANVYKATDVTDGKTVAVKILREEFYGNEEFLRRFKNESKAIAVLSHPNIIRIYDVCFSNRMQVIVEEYVDGITLKEYMEQQGTLSWKEAVHFTVQILQALSHAHERGIVHRDIKPQNVMLLRDGTIKITDFGIARFARSESRTITDRAIGSVHYISPEQAKGDSVDHRADLYSVGVMLYEMLTGTVPFDAENPVSVALKQIELQAPSPRSIRPEIPEALEEITMHAMQKDPGDRYQSAQEMLRDIAVFKRDPSVRFEYEYLTDSALEAQRYHKAVDAVKQGSRDPSAGRARRAAQKPAPAQQSRQAGRDDVREYRGRRGPSVLAALFGITVAFVIVSAVFIGAMLYFNNPLEKVPDVVVPSLTGQRYEEIRASALYSDFTIEIESTKNDETERGLVISQKPKAGTKAKTGSTIRVVISNGQQEITMPNLIGYEETNAYAELVAADLVYDRVEVYSDFPVGTVVSTSPAYGEVVPAGERVTVQVSVGPETRTFAMPNLVGKNFSDAYQVLADAGLSVGSVSYEPNEAEAGTVVQQSPDTTAVVQTGDAVNLIVSSGETGESPARQSTVTLHIPLPAEVSDVITLKAMWEGNTLLTEQVRPSDAKYWHPSFTGNGEITMFILYNDFLYQTYTVNFGTGSYRITEDNSVNHP